MARVCSEQKWVRLDSADDETENEDGDGEDEALSLCDLPINEEKQSRKKEDEAAKPIETQEQFDFSSWGGCVLPESDMCAADEVFFQGQLLPLRHSISSDSGLGLTGVRNPSRSISRSESMEHSYSGGFTSSRSSSIRSYRSSSSGSSATATATAAAALNYKPRTRNQFHSHPSPSPQIRVQSVRHGSSGQSTVWSFLRVGLMRTPEIELQDLKARSNNTTMVKSSGSRNSNSYSNNNASNTQNNKTISKFKLRLLDKMGSCKCSVINSVVETVPSRTVVIRENRAFVKGEEEEEETTRKKTKQQHGKQTLSRHRTFEWLKELSLGDEFA